MRKDYSISVLGKNINYSITPVKQGDENLFQLQCDTINMNQLFDAEDLAIFLASEDFSFFIADELRQQKIIQNRRIQIRVSEREQKIIEERTIKSGYKNVSDYFRSLAFAS